MHILNCAGSFRYFLRQKLRDEKCIPLLEISKEIPLATSSEWMAYYSRYATRKKDIVLGVS
jgi:hypothetical protein